MNIRDQKGITLVMLAVTVIVMIIIATITISLGVESIEKSNFENTRTTMLLIQAKTKASAEQINFELGSYLNGNNPISSYDQEKQNNIYGIIFESDNIIGERKNSNEIEGVTIDEDNWQVLTRLNNTSLVEMGINDPENAYAYYIIYDFKNATTDIYYATGVKYKNEVYHLLSEMNNVEIDE